MKISVLTFALTFMDVLHLLFYHEIEMFVYRLEKTFYMSYEEIRWMNGWMDVDK